MKYLAIMMFVSIHMACTPSNTEVYIPDDVFREFLLNNLEVNKNRNNIVEIEEAQNFNGYLRMKSLGIKSLQGIQEFINIEGIEAENNQLEVIDLSSNKRIKWVLLDRNEIKEINLPKQSLLEGLSLAGNQLETLNVASQQQLISLSISENPIASINLNSCRNLKELRALSTKITDLKIDKNTQLEILYIEALNKINIDKNLNLSELYFSNPHQDFDTLFTNNNPLLSVIHINQSLKSIGPSVHFSFEENREITELHLINTKVTNLDLSHNKKLKVLNLLENGLESLLLDNPLLSSLSVVKNSLRNIDLTNLPNINVLHLNYNQIDQLDFRNNTKLENLDIRSNNITSIDLSRNINLQHGVFIENPLKTIELPPSSKIRYLWFQENDFKKLDLSSIGQIDQLIVKDVSNLNCIVTNQDNKINNLTLDENIRIGCN